MNMIDWKNLNKVRGHNTGESMKHFIVKAMVAKIMVGKKYMVYTEHQISKNNFYPEESKTKIADVYAFKDKEKIIIEVESIPTKKHIQDLVNFYNEIGDLIIIDLRKISMDIQEMEKQLREILP